MMKFKVMVNQNRNKFTENKIKNLQKNKTKKQKKRIFHTPKKHQLLFFKIK